jgi:thiamine-phosphate pyrophosphorylase
MIGGMDENLIAWAKSVKARRPFATAAPVLWLFTDAQRLPDPRPAARRLPAGWCGVVLRLDGEPHRAKLGRDLARICRERRLALTVAGDARLAYALKAGLHLRGGRRALPRGPSRGNRTLLLGRWDTASAHTMAELARGGRAADLVFLSPIFPTDSHPGRRGIGLFAWAALARRVRLPVLALGGVDGATARRLPRRFCAGAGAIGALA